MYLHEDIEIFKEVIEQMVAEKGMLTFLYPVGLKGGIRMKKCLFAAVFCLLLFLFLPLHPVQAGTGQTVTMYKWTKYSLETLLGDDYNPSVKYKLKSSDRSIARYSNGIISARKAGTATFTVKANGKSKEYTVKVVKPWIQVTMLDVGQGDSFLVQTANSCILIDTGEYKEYEHLKKQLSEMGITHIDTVIATHFDTDHFGSVQSVLREYGPTLFIHPSRAGSSRDYTNLTNYLAANDVPEYIPSAKDIGKELTCLSSDDMIWTLLSSDAGTDTNDSGLVLHLSFSGSTWLFTSDVPASVLNTVMKKYPDMVDVDVLKVAHHGSDKSSPILFIKNASPLYSLIPVGYDNDYGHPASTVLSRLEKYTENGIYRTDTDGRVTIRYTKGTYSIKKFPPEGRDVAKTVQPDDTEQIIIGNIKSHVYHTESCSQLPYEANRVFFSSMAEAETAGYRAHASCCRSQSS